MIYPKSLPVYVPSSSGWTATTWETVLGAFARSSNTWVAETARAWLTHVDLSMPRVGGDTTWNDVRDGEDFVVATRARMAWVYEQLDPPHPIVHDLVGSSAGVSWVARMNVPASAPRYLIRVEAEEGLPVRDYPKRASATAPRVRGPSIKVCLVQTGVTTSKDFDWDYLLALWPPMARARSDWATAPANPRAPHDRAAWKALTAKGGPPFLGIGFGDAQARRSGECMFGARFQLDRDVTLLTVVSQLQGTTDLMLQLRAVPPPKRDTAGMSRADDN